MEGNRGCLSNHFPHLLGRKILVAPGHVGYAGVGAKGIASAPYYSNPPYVRTGTRVAHNYCEEQLNAYIVADTLDVLSHTGGLSRLCVGPFAHKACIAQGWQPDAFIEVHCNAFSDPAVRGFEVWHDGDAASETLARMIARRFLSYTPIPSRGLKLMQSQENDEDWRDQHDALFEHMPVQERTFPLVLVECGFLSNQQDADYLTDLRNHERLASALVHGLNDFFLE